MTLEQLGSVGEFVGALAVLLTLAYLAYQTRQNGELLRQSRDAQTAAMATANVQNWHQLMSSIALGPKSSEVIGKLRRGETVLEEEFDTMDALLFMDLLNLENLMFQGNYNAWTDEAWETALVRVCRRHIRWLMTSPSSLEWWEANQTTFSEDFAQFMNKLLDKSAVERE